MPYLIAQGAVSEHRWRRQIPDDRPVTIGRGETSDSETGAGHWQIGWDPLISRRHASASLAGNRVLIEQIDGATNPIFYDGKKLRSFHVGLGEHFVIGNTKFSIAADRVVVTEDLRQPDAEQSFDPQYLRTLDFQNPDERLSILIRLPEVILRATRDGDLYGDLVGLLMAGVQRATTIALLRTCDDPDSVVQVLHWDQRRVDSTDFQPSLPLIRKAIERRETVLHTWKQPQPGVRATPEGNAWAFVTPLLSKPSEGWALYVAGEQTTGQPVDARTLRDDIKFTELMSVTLANLRRLKSLEQRQASLRSFLSPVVMDVLNEQDPELALVPRECVVSVLFCDLRGFSHTSERYSKDLMELLDRVSRALGVATREILAQGGVVGDFHGDATMGFWNWPLEQPDHVVRATQAAIATQNFFEESVTAGGSRLHKFQIGIGIATGRAVAGKIGTQDQVKVSVFGPVVNLASRLESMTPYFRARILVDEATADQLKTRAPEIRLRSVAVVQPFGMTSAHTISQVLAPAGDFELLSNEHIRGYENALNDFTQGKWEESLRQLRQLPDADETKDALTAYIVKHNGTAPDDWPGFIAVDRK